MWLRIAGKSILENNKVPKKQIINIPRRARIKLKKKLSFMHANIKHNFPSSDNPVEKLITFMKIRIHSNIKIQKYILLFCRYWNQSLKKLNYLKGNAILMELEIRKKIIVETFCVIDNRHDNPIKSLIKALLQEFHAVCPNLTWEQVNTEHWINSTGSSKIKIRLWF